MSLLLLLRGTTAPPPSPPPVVTTAPDNSIRILGLSAVGQTLTVDLTNLPGSFSYQWVRATPPVGTALPVWTAIPGATGASYTLTVADTGKLVTAVLS